MHSLYILILCALVHYSAGQGCRADIELSSNSGKWNNRGISRTIYTIDITNKGTCSFSGVEIEVSVPTAAHISTSWGLSVTNQRINNFGTLASGQTHRGPGFVFAGKGKPTLSIKSFEGCGCPTSGGGVDTTGLIPSDPGNGITTTGSGVPTPTLPPPVACNHVAFDIPRYHTMGLKFLVLACNATDPRLAVAKTTFNSVGSSYDVIIASQQGATPLNLKNSDGSGKYLAIVAATEIALNCWTRDQMIEVEGYEKDLGAKLVILYSFPYVTNGVQLRNAGGLSLNGATATFASDMHSSIPFYKTGVELSISGVYAYPAVIVSPSLATPAVYGNINGEQVVFAAFINYPDGRRHLEFYVDHAEFALYSALLGNAWFQWASNGVFGGLRRIEFNAHVDDIFMATGGFDANTGLESTTNLFRSTAGDLISVMNWQTALNNRLPDGSDFVLTFPFNMATVYQKGGPTGDSLFLTAKDYRDQFFWESHTYSHLYLDNLTYAAATAEWQQNTVAAKELFGENLDNPRYCRLSVVTPSISGMYNGEALRALWDLGIRHVVGDNSRLDLVPANLYHGLYTTQSYNGFAGIYIVPRHATNIYYFASEVHEVEEQFNLRYAATLGQLTFAQIVAKDVEVAARSLIQFRHDPFMFHQANLRSLTIDGTPARSLLSYWVDHVVDAVLKISTLPILSHTHDALSQMYLDREARDACGFSAQLKVDTPSGQIVGFTATSLVACRFAVSGATAVAGSGIENEAYGSENTIWLNLVPGTPLDVTFSSPVASL